MQGVYVFFSFTARHSKNLSQSLAFLVKVASNLSRLHRRNSGIMGTLIEQYTAVIAKNRRSICLFGTRYSAVWKKLLKKQHAWRKRSACVIPLTDYPAS